MIACVPCALETLVSCLEHSFGLTVVLQGKKCRNGVIMASEFDEPGPEESQNKRRALRNAVRLGAELLVSAGPRFKVAVLDLSKTGFRIETANPITIGRNVYLTIPGFQSLQARVAWNDREYYGCEFTQPLHASTFDHLSTEFPSLIS